MTIIHIVMLFQWATFK